MTNILEIIGHSFLAGFFGAFGVAIACGMMRWMPVTLTVITNPPRAPESES